jgi:uncharacterized protein YjbI with pentapeptide repeats
MGGKKPKAEPEAATISHESEEPEAAASKPATEFAILRDDLNLAARQFNTIWLAFMSLCAYLFITVWTVTPKTLFLAAPVKLPIFNVDLPLLVFFEITPLILLICHAFLVLLAKGVEGKVQKFAAEVDEVVFKQPTQKTAKPARLSRKSPIMINAEPQKPIEPMRALDNILALNAYLARHSKQVEWTSWKRTPWRIMFYCSMVLMPLGLMILFHLQILAFQDEQISNFLRWMIGAELILSLVFALPTRSKFVFWRRIKWFEAFPLAFSGWIFGLTSSLIFSATFPGEALYTWGESVPFVHQMTLNLFEGDLDIVDPSSHFCNKRFCNRLVMTDQKNLFAESQVDRSSGPLETPASNEFEKTNNTKSNAWGNPSYLAPHKRVVHFSARLRNFRKAVFDNSNLSGIDFVGADFSGASLARTDLHDSDFGCSKPEYDTGENKLYAFRNKCAILEGAILNNTDLTFSNFQDSESSGVFLKEALLSGANFTSAKLYGSNLNSAEGLGTAFTNAKLRAADMSNSKLIAADFTEADMLEHRTAL